MDDYVIVDAHMHCFRTAEAGRLAMGLTPPYASHDGTIEDALSAMKKTGMSKAIMVNTIPLAYMREAARRKLSPALSPAQRQQAEAEIERTLLDRLTRLNAWSCEAARKNSGLYATITLDPILDPESLKKEVEDKVQNGGAKALKLHPPIGRYYPNDERMRLAYEAAARLGIPIIFHCGPHPHPDDPQQAVEYSRPRHFEALLSSYPKLTVVMAHMGMGVGPDWAHLYKTYFEEAMAIATRHYPNAYFDLSECIAEAMGGYGMPPEDIVALTRAIGADKVLFGTDFPWYEPATVIQGVLNLDLTEREKRVILGENAIRVFKLD